MVLLQSVAYACIDCCFGCRSFCSRDPHPDAQTPCNKVDGVHLDMLALDSELLLYNCSPSSGGELSLSGCPAIPLCALVRVGVCVCVSMCVSVCLETGDDI